ncbi:DUF4185 domain-containing protein [Hoyosella rhizosphaerae]|nr:DUF4185 domain-containing protein [Hoyosella rhizosphaerae]MBN4927993.1 DUF4185 domain-containing protein [Hoyosella rhizosphaerae]
MRRFSKVCDLTGPGTSSCNFDVVGTDLGIPVELPGGRELAWIFGDTFSGVAPGTPGWRSPVLLRSADQPLEDGVEFCSCAGKGQARRLVRGSNRGRTTWLPADAITIGDATYLFAMRNDGLHNVTQTRIFASTDAGESWKKTRAKWSGKHDAGNMQLITWVQGPPEDNWIYVFSTGFQRNKPLFLYRVAVDDVTNPKAWVPWGWTEDTGWRWGNTATPVLTGQFGEMSLRRVDGKYVLVWFDAGGYQIQAMVLDHPTDNLFETRQYTLLRGTSWEDENHAVGDVAQLYGGYIVPGSTLDDLHISVSQWNTTTNKVYKAMLFHGSLPR